MSHKTHYKTFTQQDITLLEKDVNDHIHNLYKDEKISNVKIENINTLQVGNTFIAAMTYTYSKVKKTDTIPIPVSE